MDKGMSNNEVKLSIKGIHLSFGKVNAVEDVSMEVAQDEISAIIGPNGAGKTCILNCINGFYRPQKGSIFFEGKDITRLPVHKIAALGIARTFQNIELYTGLSTLDNLMAARHVLMKYGAVAGSIYFGKAKREEVFHREEVERIIKLLELEEIRKTPVGLLPYGQRKKVELGRALALEPKLLLLDEPMAGMNTEEKEDMARFVIDVFELKRIPIVLIEHDMGVVMDIASWVTVLDFGRKIAEGTPSEVKANPDVIKAYLGGAILEPAA
jgi:branched-chain amino acid transport system ATP-binding protein